MAFVPSRRQHARFACALSLFAIAAGGRGPLEGLLLNVGIGGAYVKLKGTLPKPQCTLRINCGEDTFAVDARVVRIAPADPADRAATFYGLEFLNDSSTKLRVRSLVDRVRSGLTNLP
ncbi:MAG: PilZ domain-containing protein [Elusimicrobia bacterium]|nr:PilZ domain-containing protein [Elusimicrobiota bacterium]